MQFRIYTLLVALLLTGQAFGQLTITLESFPRQVTVIDSAAIVTVSPDFEAPAGGEDVIWDYSGLTTDSLIITAYVPVDDDPIFAEAYSKRDRLIGFQTFDINAQNYFALDENSFRNFGRSTESISYPLGGLTQNPGDTLAFPAFSHQFPGSLDYLRFPASLGDSWMNEQRELTPFELTFGAFGEDHSPGINVRIITEEREIIGAGEISFPEAPGFDDFSSEALLVRVLQTFTDSVYINGESPNPVLLGAFGIVQGATTIDEFYVWYRPGFGFPLASTILGDGKFFFSPQAGLLPPPSSVTEALLPRVTTYPNPVAAGDFLRLETGSQLGSGVFELTDLQGRTLVQRPYAAFGQSSLTVQLPDGLASGLYVYRLKNETGRLLWSGKVQVAQ